MEDTILSVDTSGRSGSPVVVAPSATLDLVYACFYLNGAARRPHDVPSWAQRLMRDAPAVAADAAALGDRAAAARPASVPIRLALDHGHPAHDDALPVSAAGPDRQVGR